MANQLTIASSVQPRSAEQIAAAQARAVEVTQGISEGFGKVTYKGGKWGVKYKGNHTPLVRFSQAPNGQMVFDGAEPFLECVLLDAAERTSKIFYETGYVEGTTAPPDCWSNNGLAPDAGAPKKQSPTCAGCSKNAWGSAKPRADGQPSRGKACADHKRLATVPVKDIKNETYGGPLLFQVPPSSLKNYAEYVKQLGDLGYQMHEVWTRVSFDPQSAYPLMSFDAVGVLTPDQMKLVNEVSDDPIIDRILNTEVVGAEGWDDPDMQDQNVTSEGKPQPKAASTPTPQPQPAAPPPPPPPPPPVEASRDPSYQYSPDGKFRWKAGMAAWDLVPLVTPPPPPSPPPLPVGPPPLPGVSSDEATTTVATPSRRRSRPRTQSPSPTPHDSAAAQQSAVAPELPMNPAPTPPNGAAGQDVTAQIAAAIDKLI